MSWSHIADAHPIARKVHQCVWCGQMIEKGEKHYSYTGTMDGEFQHNRAHLDCESAMNLVQEQDSFFLGDGFGVGEFPRGCSCIGLGKKCNVHYPETAGAER